MQVRSELKLLFTGLVTQYPGAGRLFDSMWKEIDEAYNAPHRYYHNMDHLHYINTRLDECPQKPSDAEALRFCLLYHDIVYEIPNRENEKKSSDIAARRMKGLGVPPPVIDLCVKHILATKEHEPSDNEDTNLFCDADIAILGDTPRRYSEYTMKVREEYKEVTDADFTRGRKRELEKLLAMPRLFKTPFFYEKYESQARINIGEEIKRLSEFT